MSPSKSKANPEPVNLTRPVPAQGKLGDYPLLIRCVLEQGLRSADPNPLDNPATGPDAKRTIVRDQVFKASKEIVVKGLKKAQADYLFPTARVGSLIVVDDWEIDSYRSIQILLKKYIHDAKWDRPLSLAVFGPPGCGKSFGIRQVAEGIELPKGVSRVSPLECNLAQFAGVGDLAGEFHRARDEVLAGRVPIVMFDEFDSTFDGRPYGWLRYFLSPMQDARFKHGETFYHIARSIFVFIGGINPSYERFQDRFRDPEFVTAKGRDFVSRLRGFLDILGPDRKHEEDYACMVRRAIILRDFLISKLPVIVHPPRNGGEQYVAIDDGVLRAFLMVDEFKHGVRSIQSIVEMSHPSVARRKFEKSSLPIREQLDLHVDAAKFMEFANQPNPEGT